VTGGWSLVVASARRQIALDLAAMAGRSAATPAGAGHRLRAAVAMLAVLVIVVLTITMFVHGVVADGPEHLRGFDRG
jgi:hypothetical protein